MDPLEESSPSTAPGIASIVAIVAALAMCVACFLEWGNDVVFATSVTAKGVPLYVVWNASGTGAGVALLWPVLLVALVALAGTLLPRLTKVAIAGSAVGALLGFLYLNAVKTKLSDGFDDFGSASLGKAVGVGAWLYCATSLVVLVALVVRLRVRSLATMTDVPVESLAEG